MPKATMSDVARQAGVDVSTVSRALNERTAGLLRDETVERVHAAARELGYQPNQLARGLRTRRSHTVGMVLPDLTDPSLPPVVRGIEDALEAQGYALIIADTDGDERREERVLDHLVGRQVDGLVLAGADGTGGRRLPSLPLPTVLVNRRSHDDDIPAVVCDDDAGVAAAVDHLVGLGHRRIAHVGGPSDTDTGRGRASAFEASCRAAGCDDADRVVAATALSVEAGRDAAARLLARIPDVTAVVAASDLLAVGCLRALLAAGHRVPADVSLVGFGDLPSVEFLDPPLTTVRVPGHALGHRAGQVLLAAITGAGDVEMAPLRPELVVRGSTDRPPG